MVSFKDVFCLSFMPLLSVASASIILIECVNMYAYIYKYLQWFMCFSEEYIGLTFLYKHVRLTRITLYFCPAKCYSSSTITVIFSLSFVYHVYMMFCVFSYVFLGLTKCGQFVVSYTCQMDAMEQTGLPYYMYKLQWWWFVPSRPLIKVSENICKILTPTRGLSLTQLHI